MTNRGLEKRAEQLAKLEELYTILGQGYLRYQIKLQRLMEKALDGTLDFEGEQSVHVTDTPLDEVQGE